MTLLCVAIFVTDRDQAVRDALAASEAGADLVELRVDQFTDVEDVRSLLSGIRVPTILTCRPVWEGGSCELPEAGRLKVLEEAALSGPTYIDIELRALREAELSRIDPLLPRARRPGLIVSAHDFNGRPPRLTNLIAEMEQGAGDINKVVWTARSIRDNIEAFEILLRPSKPTIALCMGEAGLISRVLAKKFGAFLSFASLRNLEATAPGQISVDEMKRLYRWDSIGAATRVYGVVARPVAHSMSPAVHNAAFDETGFDGVYLPMLVNDGYESFKAFMESFVTFEPLDLSGLSVTLPHKENALRYLVERGARVDPLAAAIGAVNTIVISRESGDTRLQGLNTDYGAILDSITASLKITRADLAGRRVAVIGAGGTGRTAVAALAHYGATVVVYNRTRERADALAREFNGKTGKVVSADAAKLCDSCCQIYINTTSVGMHPNVGQSAWGETPPALGPEHLVFDTVYNPSRTRFLRTAEEAGAAVVGGVEMFVRQAAAQFEAWTNQPAPDAVMRSVVERRLAAG